MIARTTFFFDKSSGFFIVKKTTLQMNPNIRNPHIKFLQSSAEHLQSITDLHRARYLFSGELVQSEALPDPEISKRLTFLKKQIELSLYIRTNIFLVLKGISDNYSKKPQSVLFEIEDSFPEKIQFFLKSEKRILTTSCVGVWKRFRESMSTATTIDEINTIFQLYAYNYSSGSFAPTFVNSKESS